jgi:RNA polymerase sigma-70 factor (ECF subfamily)
VDSEPPPNPANANPVFATTHWGLVLLAGAGGSPEAETALARLCQTYWYPVYAFFRREGRPPEEAEDLTQSFFAMLLERDDLARVHPEKGRFRSFLLASARNFLKNDWNRSRRLKRGGGAEVFSIQGMPAEEWYQLEPVDDSSADKLFDRRWAETLVEQSLMRLKEDCEAAGQAPRFEVLRDFVLGDPGDLSYAEAGARLGLSESAVTSAIHRMRNRFRELLRIEVSHTLENLGDVDAEMRDLLAVLSGDGR